MRVDEQAWESYNNVDDSSLSALLWANERNVDWDTLELRENPIIPSGGADTHIYAGVRVFSVPAQNEGVLSVDPVTGQYVSGVAAIQNAISDRIYTILGSRWLRPTYGIDLLSQQIISSDFEVERLIRLCLEPDNDWYQITSYNSEQSGSSLIIRMTITGSESVFPVEVVL